MENKLNEVGIDCPNCKSFVHTPIDQVLFGNAFECRSCTLQFMLDKNSSELVLKQLQEINFTF